MKALDDANRIKQEINDTFAKSLKGSVAEWLEWTRRYRLIIESLYEADDPLETIYAFHYAVSIVTRLLAVSLSMKLLLKPLKNQLSHLSGSK